MPKTKKTTTEDVQASVTSIYSQILAKRDAEKAQREEEKEKRRQAAQEEKEAKKLNPDGTKMSKKERQEAAFESWKEIVIGLTGEDLEYSSRPNKRKKYKRWIDDDQKTPVIKKKPKKAKKKNYRKEFEPELNMLRSIVADQNRFTVDLQKRFQNAAGPATKDAMPLSKNLVDLAANINTSRSNSLGMLKAIGDLKRTIADLYMKQKKQDAELNGGKADVDSADLMLLGSNIAAQKFQDTPFAAPVVTETTQVQTQSGFMNGPDGLVATATATSLAAPATEEAIPAFDPSTWAGPPGVDTSLLTHENTPHKIVVEWHKDEGKARFKAIREDTGEELPPDYPTIPTVDPSKLTFNETDMTVRGQFDEVYPLEIIGEAGQ